MMQSTSNYVPENSSGAVQPGTEPVRSPDTHESVANKHFERVQQELRDAGVSRYGMWTPESRYLPRMIHDNEHVKAVVHGWQPGGAVMLAATDRRIIFLDKKPFSVRNDEVSYDNVRGVSHYHAGFTSTIILHTQVQDYTVRTFNKKCIQQFIDYVELRSFEHKTQEDLNNDWTGQERTV
jgi:hypothetical protein